MGLFDTPVDPNDIPILFVRKKDYRIVVVPKTVIEDARTEEELIAYTFYNSNPQNKNIDMKVYVIDKETFQKDFAIQV